MDRRFFHRLGASRLDRTICFGAGGAGLCARSAFKYGTEPEQFRHSKLIIAWGANVLATNVHLWPFIVEARRNGARFYTIDPVRNRTGKLADKHFAIYPGSDLALALGLMHVIIGEKCTTPITSRITPTDLKRWPSGRASIRRSAWSAHGNSARRRGFARARVRHHAAGRIRLNYGIQRSERGGAATRAIAALPALVGSWREVGGGLQLSTSQAFHLNKAGLEMPELQRRSPLGREARIVNMTSWARRSRS
jgi:anaerobic selenocysteine-containing dehydrogenase